MLYRSEPSVRVMKCSNSASDTTYRTELLLLLLLLTYKLIKSDQTIRGFPYTRWVSVSCLSPDIGYPIQGSFHFIPLPSQFTV
jgi:hypothetical protein